jgi:two-component system, LytTR family, sensor kinase
MQNLKSEKVDFQDARKKRLTSPLSRIKTEPSQILQTLSFLSLGILSWLGFSYLFTLYIKILQGGSLTEFPWHYDAPIWAFKDSLAGAAIIIGVKWFFGLLSEKSKSLIRDFFVLASLIPLNALLITALWILVLGISYTGRKTPDAYDWVMGFLHDFILQIFVGFTCIGYFYLTLVNKTKERLLQAQRAKSEMELKSLQQNIEPHFLFNNLNVLSSLIDSNPSKANDFLSKLAELYRYILQTQTLEVVPLKDELTFAKNYICLLRERFGDAYNFAWNVPENKINGQMIVPVSLQTLIENAVKHNAGSNENPLPISINLDENSVSVENEIREKQLTFPTNQSGLQNLKTRYAFLTEKPVEIWQATDKFKVTLPLVKYKRTET